MSSHAPVTWTVDPDDPRAPPSDIWQAMSAEERRAVIEALPSELPHSEANPPEGDFHFHAKTNVREVLDGYFSRIGRRVYLACEMATYYPGERMFSPDVLAVLDVETHARERWMVEQEGRGLDFALEVLVSGNARKDLRDNVERYARLAIPEYFVFDRARLRLFGHRLSTSRARTYEPIVPQGGRYRSQVLGLELHIEGARLRFSTANAALPDSRELVQTLERMVGDVEERFVAAEEQARASEDNARAERARAEAAEARLAEALAEIERLRRDR